jgi:hypothetical protein
VKSHIALASKIFLSLNMSKHLQNIVDQINGGKRVWTIQEVPDRDFDLFINTILKPLRALAASGLIDGLTETHGIHDGIRMICRASVSRIRIRKGSKGEILDRQKIYAWPLNH